MYNLIHSPKEVTDDILLYLILSRKARLRLNVTFPQYDYQSFKNNCFGTDL